MPRKLTNGNLALAGYDDIFSVGKPTGDGECVIKIPLADLYPPEYHPFLVIDDEAMNRLTMSVKPSITTASREKAIPMRLWLRGLARAKIRYSA